MEFTEQWCDVIRPSRGDNQLSGGIEDGLELVHDVIENASQH